MQAQSTLSASPSPASGPRIRRRLDVRGRVQGVGFRPFVWRLAADLGLDGQVGNNPQGAFIVVQGPQSTVEAFARRLLRELPQPGQISSIESADLALEERPGFLILQSQYSGETTAEVTPDLDVCPDCLRELADPADRRHRYPFLNCTHCGPRYSVVLDLPYDRASTTLKGFDLCPRCRAEYEDPTNRRFHAQPIACPDCGPRLWAAEPSGRELEGDAVRLAVQALSAGAIVAIKGLGGFHLACRADDQAAVERLRLRKAREAKPFAVMVADLDQARRAAWTDPASEAALLSPARPIVLVPKRKGSTLANAVAPDTGRWGLMLPSTPLHHLLLGEGGIPLVMTSGNPSGEPLCSGNDEALRRLAGLADLFLLHDRPIARRLDDSVVVAVDDGVGQGPVLLPLRRARGYVPAPVALPFRSAEAILAVGGELKSTVCVLKHDQAVLSEHLGELDHPAALRNFLEAGARLQQLLRAPAQRLAADLHPLYAATRWAQAQKLPLTLVQHHHAHVASCMAEHGLSGRVVGVACDGTGYGTDGSIWGGEILVCGLDSFTRAGHLATYALPGGDAAVRDPWRPALGLLKEAWPLEWTRRLGPLARLAGAGSVELVARRLDQGKGSVPCTSLGRLFDAAAALLGFCGHNRFEAEAAMILQHAAEGAESAPLPWELAAPERPGEPWILDTRPLLRALTQGGSPEVLARGFHEGIAGLLADGAAQAASDAGLARVVLSGGCFANALLLRLTAVRLQARGLQVFIHRQTPCGDGGLALGQAAVAAQACLAS